MSRGWEEVLKHVHIYSIGTTCLFSAGSCGYGCVLYDGNPIFGIPLLLPAAEMRVILSRSLYPAHVMAPPPQLRCALVVRLALPAFFLWAVTTRCFLLEIIGWFLSPFLAQSSTSADVCVLAERATPSLTPRERRSGWELDDWWSRHVGVDHSHNGGLCGVGVG